MNKYEPGLWQATIRLEGGPVEDYIDLLDEDSAGVSIFETENDNPAAGWTITALYRAQPDIGALTARLALTAAAIGLPDPAIEIAPLAATDWLSKVYASFPPRRIGRFYVHGSHVASPKGGVIGLHVDAGTAFGSGEHATTEGCLRAISDLARGPARIRRVLDMGTGSGILAIATSKLFRDARVAAVDIDAESAKVAAANARLNRVGGQMRAARGDGYRSPLAARGKQFDLIIANILARPLIRMAPSLKRRLAPGGHAILSGLLRRQEKAVLAAHKGSGLRLVRRIPIGEWNTLVLRRT